MTAKFIIMVLVLAYIMVIIAISIYLIKIICTRYNQNSDQILPPPNMHSIQESASMHLVRIGQLPHPGPGYCYYELGGMRYQALTGFDIGVHEGYAKAELNNRYDKYAVGVYREGDHKLMGYVRREQNRELYEFMLNNNCIAKAKFRIWIHQGEIYGAAYIKEEWKSSLGFKSDIKFRNKSFCVQISCKRMISYFYIIDI